MLILGISDHFTSGAAIILDGRVVAAVNEERLARRKMVMGFPRKSIAEVLRIAGVEPGQLDAVAVASQWGHFLDKYVGLEQGLYGVDEGIVKNLFFSMGSRLSFLRRKAPVLERLYYDLRQPVYAHRRRRIAEVLRTEFAITGPIKYWSHHLAHAASAYYASGWDNGLMVTLDGAGDGHSSHIYAVERGQWRHLHSVPSFDSVGDYYAYVTHICGFKAGKHEGKITGLAAYGKPSYRPILDRFIRYDDSGSMVNVGDCFRLAAINKLADALPREYDKADLAATVQQVTEHIATEYSRYWLRQSGQRNVGLAGGVFANVKVNQRIHEVEGVESVFVYPAMSDEGIAAGAGLLHWWQSEPGRIPEGKCLEQVYLGPEFLDQEIETALRGAGLEYGRPANRVGEIAKLVSDGYVVARFAGRMEYGPRALGNRSILYRPDEPEVNDWLNKRLKRTEFMPFAPSVLAEDADRYFAGLDGARDTARFMTITFDCTDLMKRACPGVVHVDGTARPQLVSRSDNPEYHQILTEFKRLTGLSCFVNTSFNIHEEPIVCSPADAVRAFQDGHLDVLAIGPFLAKSAGADERVRSQQRHQRREGVTAAAES